MTACNFMMARDLYVAAEVRKCLELGFFDTQFIQYGAAYWNNDVHYIICDDKMDLQKRLTSFKEEETYSTPILTFSRDMHVPMGMKEVYDSKLRAVNIKDLKRRIPEEYFEILRMIPLDSQDTAVEVLEPIQEAIVGRSHKVYLNLFQGLVEFARECHQLTYATYAQYLDWIDNERAFINQRIEKEGRFTKEYHGFLYNIESNNPRFYVTATEEDLIAKRNQLYMQNVRLTPVLTQRVSYSEHIEARQLRKEFTDTLRLYMNEDYLQIVRAIYNFPCSVSADMIRHADKTLQEADLGDDVANAWKLQCIRWGVFDALSA